MVAGSIPVRRTFDIMAEWLRRWTANPLGSARAGSNPADVAFFALLAQSAEHQTLNLIIRSVI